MATKGVVMAEGEERFPSWRDISRERYEELASRFEEVQQELVEAKADARIYEESSRKAYARAERAEAENERLKRVNEMSVKVQLQDEADLERAQEALRTIVEIGETRDVRVAEQALAEARERGAE